MKQLERIFGLNGAALDSTLSIRNGYLEYLVANGWKITTAWRQAVPELYR